MKNLAITQDIKDKIRASAGVDVSVENLSVYESILLNTMPLSKKNTIFDNAVVAHSTLTAMAEFIDNYPGGVPVQVMHDNTDLPVGKLFYAEVLPAADGHDEIRGLFYINNQDNKDLKKKLDAGIIDEVSVGLLNKAILCSECGFDFLGPDASFENLWDATCGNGHVVGVNGCHTRLIGVDTFYEVSLVSRGAANKAKIVGPSESLLKQDSFRQLAANGLAPREQCLFAIKTTFNKEKNVADNDHQASGLDLNALVGELTDLKAAKVQSGQEIDSLKAQVAEKDKSITDLNASIEANKDVDKDKVTADLKLADDFIRDVAKRSLIAVGSASEDKLPDSISEVIKLTKDAQAKLSAIIPVGGVSTDAHTDNPNDQKPHIVSLQAFKSNQKG